MNILDIIDDKTILITPSDIRTKLLKNNNKHLFNIRSFTKEELRHKLLFDYNEQAIYYLMKEYNLKEDIAIMYLNNMYYIDDVIYDHPKLNNLVAMKNELFNHNLLNKDKLFPLYFNNAKVIVYGYDYIDKSFNKSLDIIKNYTEIQIINNDKYINKPIKVYEFTEIDDEVAFVAHSISHLIKNGVDINNIKLGNVGEEYLNSIERIFNFYNIPINLNKSNLYGNAITLSFIDLLNESFDFKVCLDKLSAMYDIAEEANLNIYNKIVGICNNYLWCSDMDTTIIEMIINDLKHTSIINSLNKAIEIINLKDNLIEDNEYIFILGFNQGSIPIIYKNEDYITDDLALLLNLETTYEKNTIEEDIWQGIIKHLNHLTITYKLKTKTNDYYPSSLIETLGMEIIKKPKFNSNISYSVIQDEISLSKKLDKLVKYDELDNDTAILYHNYPDLPYKKYNNQFKGLDNKQLLTYLNNRLSLSYSSIDDYFKCAFKYYINNIMKFKNKEEAFHLTIGNLFHYILSCAFKPNFNFDDRWNEFLDDKALTSKEQFFLRKLHDELIFIIEAITEQNRLSTFDKSLYEEKIYVNIPNKINVTFSGIVDKIMYKENDNTLVSLVDYKTGNTDININNVVYGLNMQLPIYLYLVKNSHRFNNPTFVGFYLQEILHNEIYNDHTKDYETKKKESLKLKGYTIDKEDLIEQFDNSYKDSRVIKSMKLSSKGFYAYSKVMNEKQIDSLITLVGDKIKEGTDNILNGEFKINPKRLGGKNIACEFCDFRDICYMRDSDIITLKEYKNNDFLGGDTND